MAPLEKTEGLRIKLARFRCFNIWVVSIAAAMLAQMTCCLVWWPRRQWLLAEVVVLLFAGIASRLWARRLSRDVECFLRTNGFLPCPVCFYPLASDAEFSRCSECGRTYEAPAVEAYWRSPFDADRRLPDSLHSEGDSQS